MDVLMPQLGETVAEETDKVSMEVPSIAAGTLTEIKVQTGETALVGAVVAVIAGEGGKTASAPAASAAKVPPPAASKVPPATFALAIAVTFASASPVSSVSSLRWWPHGAPPFAPGGAAGAEFVAVGVEVVPLPLAALAMP